MKALTLIYTLHNPTDDDLEKISQVIFSNREDFVDIVVISDNPELNEFFSKNLPDRKRFKFKFVPCKVNKRKNRQIFDNLNTVKTKFFKICDPDDRIDIRKLNQQLILLEKYPDNSLILHKQNSERTLLKLKLRYKHYKERSHNSNTIYPTNIFKGYPQHKDFLIWSDDFIGFWALVNGCEAIKSKIDFYINIRHNGISTTKSNHESNQFYYDSITFIEESIKLVGNNKEKLLKFKHITGKPNKWFFKEIINDMNLNTKLTRKERVAQYQYLLEKSKELIITSKDYKAFSKMSKKII